MQDVTVYRDPARYAGWPANYGMWSWGDELVLCFSSGYPGVSGGLHTRDKARPLEDTGRGGNPPTLTALADGRLVLTYGYRAPSYGLRAKVSADGGVSWSSHVVLRADGGGPDLGYPRTVSRSDGNLVTAYYFNDRPDGERYIAATIWQP